MRILNVSKVVPPFNGEPSQFKIWIKDVEKYGVSTGITGEEIRLVAYQSSRNSVSDFIGRYLKDKPEGTWEELKAELGLRFAC
jgi:hypothetical protein